MRHIPQVILLLLALALTALALAVPALAAGGADQGTAPSPVSATVEAPPLWDSPPHVQFVDEPACSGEDPPDCDEEPTDPACCEEGSTEPHCRPPVYPFPDPNGVVDDPPSPPHP